MADVEKSKLLDKDPGIRLKDACVVLVKTEWNAGIVDRLAAGCVLGLKRYGIKNIITITVPGAVEIPFTIQSYWNSKGKRKRPDAFITLGCVIRGGTPHFGFVSKIISEGVLQLNLQLPVPTIFGVLTVDNEEQANERVGGKHGHKGEEAAATAAKMIHLARSFKK